MTTFRCLRNFHFSGHGDYRIGEMLDLNDDQARELVALGDAVEPVAAKDRSRIVVERNRIDWELPDQEDLIERPSIVGFIGDAGRRRPLAA